MKVYISGPITGRDQKKYKKDFETVAALIRENGDEAINPADCSRWGLSWGLYMGIARSVLESGEVDAICMLRGWQDSRGASRERFWAIAKGIPVIYQDPADEKRYRLAV